jgi:predicted transglutaminase-like cysteine proteinase
VSQKSIQRPHKASGLFSSALFVLICLQTETQAAFDQLKPSPKSLARITLGAPTLAPLAHTRFCLRHAIECQGRPGVARHPHVSSNAGRRAELERVNKQINDKIKPRRTPSSIHSIEWTLHPEFGDCKDYAATKRHELLSRGWPSRALLLAEVVMTSGEHHLVLVVHTEEGDLVLDNLDPDIKDWSETPFAWIRIQSPKNPKYWLKLRSLPRNRLADRYVDHEYEWARWLSR